MQIQGVIPRDFIDQLLARVNLVDVVNARVPLKKAGATYKACCPFHQEKTPSFNVNPNKQFYHCFGCGAHGDAITFLVEHDGLTFVEAVEVLAQQVGMTVPRKKMSRAEQKVQQQRVERERDLYDISHDVAKFYRRQLRDHSDSAQAKTYLRQRGLTPEVAKRFIIGFAPPGWASLIKGLQANSRVSKQLIELGLLVEKQPGNSYDRFRHRIMFPIRNGKGQVIAFGGRVLRSEDQPKYLNSPESPIFHKSDTLYGLYEWRQSRDQSDYLIVVEGYMDVVALAQHGVNNAVATLGTAITESHCQLLFRQVDELVFCFDGDKAGLAAAWKALELVLPQIGGQRSVKFLFLDEGEDPDSAVRKLGEQGFRQQVAQALPLSDFFVQHLLNKLSVSVDYPEGRQQLVALAQPYILRATALYQYFLIELLASQVGLPVWRLERQLGLKPMHAAKRDDSAKQDRFHAQAGQKKLVKPKMSLARFLVRILLDRPEWAAQLALLLTPLLPVSNQQDARMLLALLACYQLPADQQNDAFEKFNHDYAQQLDYIQRQPLPDAEAEVKTMFQDMAIRLADELEVVLLRQKVHQGETIEDLQAFLTDRKNRFM
ncbi:DNA primase [Thiomicrospira sp. ALE5]|uniref:DNA primase n=1 Tax=Thiomicrospira sp. ALE5 TaxID=748650 RepID=UPI0008F0FAD5|nr:DNA primase [Thiomicrospira sp. ALE5]SFR60967.1 DNA primase [Thiomicrospira sp. ALE5]